MDQIAQKELLRKIFAAGIERADPRKVLAEYLPEKPRGRCYIVGAGKSGAAMAQAVEAAWPDVHLSGAVVVPYGHGLPTRCIEVIEAAHPVPDENSMNASCRMLEIAAMAGPDDILLALISGGGSSLLTLPAPPLSLADKIEINRRLLASGLTISEMNRVRRRLSAIKGGRLANAALGARVVTLGVSDIPGDILHDIASGPTLSDPTAGDDLSHVLPKLGGDIPSAVAELLADTTQTTRPQASDFRLIATPRLALEAAADAARASGISPLILGDALEGEARQVGIVMSGIAKSVAHHGYPAKPPVILLSGGETTVTIGCQKPGRGGRNTEFLLSLALGLAGTTNVCAFAGDTDGIDGTEDAAGAMIFPDTLSRAENLRLDPRKYLDIHDSYSLFAALDDLILTGPTLTNVNDIRGVLVL